MTTSRQFSDDAFLLNNISFSLSNPPLRHALSELKAYPTSLFNELFTHGP